MKGIFKAIWFFIRFSVQGQQHFLAVSALGMLLLPVSLHAQLPENIRITGWYHWGYPDCMWTTWSSPSAGFQCLRGLESTWGWWEPHQCSWSGEITDSLIKRSARYQCDNGDHAVSVFAYTETVQENQNAGAPEQCAEAGNPINSATGNKFQTEIDFQDVLGTGLQFVRFYSSDETIDGAVGSHWRHSYQSHLSRSTTDGTLTLLWKPDGRTISFRSLGNHLWESLSGKQHRLQQEVDPSGNTVKWRYYAPDDSSEEFNELGQLVKLVRRGGQELTLSYSEIGISTAVGIPPTFLTSITDGFGRSFNLQYDESIRISGLVLPSSEIIAFSYDVDGNLSTVTYPDNSQRIYHYNELAHTSGADLPNALTGITDETGARYATFSYRADGRAFRTEHGGGLDVHVVDYVEDELGKIIGSVITSPLGSEKHLNFSTVFGRSLVTDAAETNGIGEVVVQEFSYDSQGGVSVWKDKNAAVTSFAYDQERALETSRTEAAGTAVERDITTSWHPNFRLPLTIIEFGKITTFSYDANGNLLSTSVTSVPQ